MALLLSNLTAQSSRNPSDFIRDMRRTRMSCCIGRAGPELRFRRTSRKTKRLDYIFYILSEYRFFSKALKKLLWARLVIQSYTFIKRCLRNWSLSQWRLKIKILWCYEIIWFPVKQKKLSYASSVSFFYMCA